MVKGGGGETWGAEGDGGDAQEEADACSATINVCWSRRDLLTERWRVSIGWMSLLGLCGSPAAFRANYLAPNGSPTAPCKHPPP